MEEMREIRKQILIGRQMNNSFHALQRLSPVGPVPDVADDPLGLLWYPVRPNTIAGMYRRGKIIEQPDLITSLQ